MLRSRIAVALVVAIVAAVAAPLPAQTFPAATKGAEAKLLAVLKSNASRKDKADACRHLAVIATRDAVPVLAALLADEQLSQMARYALEPMPYASVGEALRGALGKLKGRPLVGVIGSLGVRRDTKAVPALARMLGSADADVAQAAARAMGSIGTAGAVKALQGALPGATDAQQLALCEGLFRAAEALEAQGKRDEAVAIYDRLRALKGPHQVRTGALRGAILARGKDGLPLLRENLAAREYLLFAAAVQTTYEMPGVEVTQALASVLAKAPADNQVLVMQALGRRGDGAALPALMGVCKAGEKPVRLAAIRTVGQIGEASAADGLIALMGEADSDIAAAAKESLASLPGPQVDAAVMKMLGSDDAARRAAAVELIGRRRMTAVIPDLLKAAAGADAKVRAKAMKHLGELAGPAELPALLGLLVRAETEPDLRAAEGAVGAVCAKADPPQSCTGRIIALLPQAQPASKAALVRVLGGLGGEKALKAIRGCVGDANEDVHITAIRTLCAWKTPEVLPDLLALAGSAASPTDKTLGLRGYLGWAAKTKGGLPPGERLSMCRTAAGLAKKPAEKKLLLSALGSIQLPDAVAMVVPYLADAATRNEACAAAVSVAERLLKVGGRSQVAAKLVEPLKKVSAAATDADLARRAKAALKRAQSKAGKK